MLQAANLHFSDAVVNNPFIRKELDLQHLSKENLQGKKNYFKNIFLNCHISDCGYVHV